MSSTSEKCLESGTLWLSYKLTYWIFHISSVWTSLINCFSTIRYLFSLSGALVILNVVPCYALDGQWILKAFLDLFLPGILPSRPKRNMVFTVVLILGSSLLGLNLFLAILYLCLQANYTGGLSNSISPITSVNTWIKFYAFICKKSETVIHHSVYFIFLLSVPL